ncbi:MAG: retropepsin-like aspartic protease family protein [Alphaproteobacteria bacterium]
MREILIASVILAVGAMAAPMILPDLLAAVRDNRQNAAADQHSGPASMVKYRARRDGHFYLNVDINGGHIPVMVDTGASMVALRQSDAARAGLQVSRSDFTMALSTANGTSYGAPLMLDYVVLDGIEVRNVQAVIVRDELLHTNLLGASFLNRLHRFEISDNTLYIED